MRSTPSSHIAPLPLLASSVSSTIPHSLHPFHPSYHLPRKSDGHPRRSRNWKAWQLFSPDGDTCRFCPHGASDHLTSSGQPHFYRPAAEQDWRNSNEKLYRHELADGSEVLVKRITVASRAELLTAFCTACARDKQTDQVLCFQRTLAKGEVVGLTNRNGNHNDGR